jgi:hypothetical protein
VHWRWAVGSVAMWDNVSKNSKFPWDRWVASSGNRESRFIGSFRGIMRQIQGRAWGLLCLARSVSGFPHIMFPSSFWLLEQHTSIPKARAE